MQNGRLTNPDPQIARSLYRTEGRYGNAMRWSLWAVCIVALWLWRGIGPIDWSLPLRSWSGEALLLVAYAFTNLVWMLLFLPPSLAARWRRAYRSLPKQRAWILVSFLLDHLYVTALIALTGGFRSELYLLYAVLALKSAVYFLYAQGLILISFSSGVLWIGAAYLDAQSLFFLVDRGFLLRYGGLFALVASALVVGRTLKRRQRSILSLDANLSQKSRDLDNQGRVLQETANELANRVLELRSIQESVKAVNSLLALDELLQIIVESATRVLKGARCSIALVDESRQLVVTKAAAGIPQTQLHGTSFRIGQGVAGWVVENRKPVLIHSIRDDPRFQPIGSWPVESLLSVPLISAEGGMQPVIGALTATSPERDAFTATDMELLEAFADQATMAVMKASLYEQLVAQEKQTARLYQSVLEKSNELEAVLAGIGDGVIVVDPSLQLMMMNPVAARIFYVYQAPKKGVRLPELVSNQDLLDLARDTLDGIDLPVIREISLPREDDSDQIFQSLASVIKGAQDRVRGVVIVMRDVTSQKEVEQVKSNFLSVVSHELRTPLHSIKGFVEIILMGKTGELTELQRDFLTTVKESTTNLQRLIDDLLEFSRMEAGKVKLEPEQISLYDIADGVMERLSPLAQEGNLTLLNQIPEDIALIEADPMRIEQVLTNLISNAIKFTPEKGSVTVMAEDLGDQVQVSVRDTGIGIPKEEQPQIFQRFYQVDSSATRSYRGAGLGLTICKFIIEYHHGTIWVESELGEGSTFSFVLPKELPQDQELVIDFTTPVRRQTPVN
ncbi:MAG: GAF domain-containing protein [Anaerolineae bacterium]|nr:GAF domain-containing protein [Anaerolineae bacterium]